MTGPMPFEEMTDPYLIANRFFLPSRPITEPARLYGREPQLQATRRALDSPGRSVFIFGDRGVGKTSLAQTVAFLRDTTEEDPTLVSCYQATFSKVIAQVARHLMRLPYYVANKRTLVRELKLGGAAGHILNRVETRPDETVTIEPMYAVDVLNEVAPRHKEAVVVIDEIDLASDELKRDFAHFVKQVGDKDCPVKFIFTGIAENVDELLVEHESASRYIAAVKLERLLLGDVMDVMETGFGYLKIDLPEVLNKRVALMSDGFGHFAHLLGLKLALRAIDAESTSINEALLEGALEDSVSESDPWLRKSYEQAVRKYHDRYESILWALADHYLLIRSSKDVYNSYLEVCRQRHTQIGRTFVEPDDTEESPSDEGDQTEGGDSAAENDDETHEILENESNTSLTVLTKTKFSQALYRLKQDSHGRVLESKKKGWHEFKAPMMRGYCRIVAASHGIHIGLRYLDSRNKLVELPAPTKRS